MRKFWLLLFLLVIPCLKGQDTTQTVLLSSGTPANPCTARRLDIDITNNLLYFCSNAVWVLTTSGGGSGTVTNIATTSPITGGPITTTGTIACATCAIGPGVSTANHLAKFSGTDGITLADGGAIPAGTVTSIATTGPIGGGTITSTGTITCTTCATTTSGGALTLDQVGNPAAAWTFDEGVTPNVGIITSNNNSAVNVLTLKDTSTGNTAQGCLNFANSGASVGYVCFNGTGITSPNSVVMGASTGSLKFMSNNAVAGTFDTAQNFTVGTGGQLTVNASGQVSKYNGQPVSAQGYGVPATLGGILSASLTANVGTTTLFAVPAGVGGTYRITGTEALVTPAGTSSTLPNVTITCTNRVSSGVLVFSPTMTFSAGGASGNTTTSAAFFQTFCDAKASTNIQYATTGYASNAANAMAYSLYILVESM